MHHYFFCMFENAKNIYEENHVTFSTKQTKKYNTKKPFYLKLIPIEIIYIILNFLIFIFCVKKYFIDKPNLPKDSFCCFFDIFVP